MHDDDPKGPLPDAFTQKRREDEPFWQQQEQRIQGAMGQPACTLSGISTGLINLPGNFAVVIHGEDECAACFRHIGPNTHNFFCVGLTEREFVTGEMKEPLVKCLRLVASEVKPDAIFVLGACPVEVIGDRFETYVEEVQAEFPDIPMRAMHTSGLKVGSQAAMLDWMWSTLAAIPGRPPTNPDWKRQVGDVGLQLLTAHVRGDADGMDLARDLAAQMPAKQVLPRETSLNFIGMPRRPMRGDGRPEHLRMLDACGLSLVASFPHEAIFEDWTAIKHAAVSFVVDRSLYPKLINELEGSGQRVIEVPLPTGLEQTEEFYRIIGRAFDREDAIVEAFAADKAMAEAELDAFQARFAGLRLAMGLRMNNNYQADHLAYGGLGDFKAFEELGFDMTLMVQGPPDRADRFERLFRSRGIEHPFQMFPEPWTLSEHIGGDRFDVAYLADHCRTEARKAGVPMIVNRAFEPYFDGVGVNLRHLTRTMRDVLPPDFERTA